MSNSVIIGSFPYSGDRYFNAFLCSNFPHFISYSANYFPFESITDTPEENLLIKTQSNDPNVDFYVRAIYLIRDPADIAVEYIKETDGKEKISSTISRWKEHVLDWKVAAYHNEILFIRYEDIINNKENALQKISEFFDGITIEPNESRTAELEESLLEVGTYKDTLSEEDILFIREQTDIVMKELPW